MSNGKLLLLRYQDRLMALLYRENRLLSVRVYEEEKASFVGNIYIGKVSSIAENIGAAFVDIADKCSAYLPLSDVKQPHLLNRSFDGRLKAGDELVVQVLRDAVKTKQPVLTTRLSLSGNYLVLSDGSDKLGMSAKLSKENKLRITDYLLEHELITEEHTCRTIENEGMMTHANTGMTMPHDGMMMSNIGMVVRTNAGTLVDFAPLLTEWKLLADKMQEIRSTATHRTCFSCLYQNRKPYLADLKNYYEDDFEELVTDCKDIYEELTAYYEEEQAQGRGTKAVRFYKDAYPLEKLYSVKTNLEHALDSHVWLKSGGYLIIEPTEALTVIDVNTGKYEAGKHNEDTYFTINMEAAEEIALQLRLRNLSGIIVVDFINMKSEEHRQKLMERLNKLVKVDAVRTVVVDMTPLGLIEITRKRIDKPLREVLTRI